MEAAAVGLDSGTACAAVGASRQTERTISPRVPVVTPELSCAHTLVPINVATKVRQTLANWVLRGGQIVVAETQVEAEAEAEEAFRLPLAASETAWQAPIEWFKTRL